METIFEYKIVWNKDLGNDFLLLRKNKTLSMHPRIMAVDRGGGGRAPPPPKKKLRRNNNIKCPPQIWGYMIIHWNEDHFFMSALRTCAGGGPIKEVCPRPLPPPPPPPPMVWFGSTPICPGCTIPYAAPIMYIIHRWKNTLFTSFIDVNA